MNGVKALHERAGWAPSAPTRWVPTREENALVAEKRAIRASWPAIAKMLGRPEPDVRRAYDGACYTVAPIIPAPVLELPTLPTHRKNSTGKPRSTDTIAGRVLSLLSDGAELRTGHIIEHIKGNSDSIAAILCDLREHGLLTSRKRGSYRITDTGREVLAKVPGRQALASIEVSRG